MVAYPSSVPALPRPGLADYMDTPGLEGDVLIDRLADEIEAIATELGVDPSGVAATVKARLDAAEAGSIPKSLFDVNTLLKADTDNTPTALTVPASTLVGRGAAGGIAALTPEQSADVIGRGGWLWAPPPSGGDDTAALQAVLNAVPVAGGVVMLRAGSYSVPSGGLTCSRPVAIVGAGAGTYESGGTRLQMSSTTATLLTLSAPGSVVQGVCFESTATINTETASIGLLCTDFDWGRVERCMFIGFYNQMSVTVGYFYSVSKCAFLRPKNYGLYMRNTATEQYDHGDQIIEGCNFSKYGDSNNGGTAIRWESGGGLRVVGCKVNAGTQPGYTSTGFWDYGFDTRLTVAGATSVLVVSGCSIEGWTLGGIRATGIAGTSFGKIVVAASEFLSSASNCVAVEIDGTAMTSMGNVVVTGCVAYGSGGGVKLTNLTNAVVVGNDFSECAQTWLQMSYVRGLRQSGNIPSPAGTFDYDHDRYPYATYPTAGHARGAWQYSMEINGINTNGYFGVVSPGDYSAGEMTIQIEGNVATVGAVRISQTRQITRGTGACTVGAALGTDIAFGPAAAEVSLTFDTSSVNLSVRPYIVSVNGKVFTGTVSVTFNGVVYRLRTA